MSISVYAYDVIVKKDGTIIEGKVEKITSVEVEYKKASNLDGPTYTISIADLLAINYDNGEKETFGTSSPMPESSEDVKTASPVPDYNPTAITRESASMFSTDNELRRLNASYNYNNPNSYSKKARVWRIAGWAVGGTLLAGGIIMAGRGYWRSHSDVMTWGIVMGVVGLGFGTTALIIGHNYAKKAKEWAEIYSLIGKDLEFNDGSRLKFGLDMITYNDGFSAGGRVKPALGVGFNYSF